jgi:hypothetical protein
MSMLPMSELKRVRDFVPKYHPNAAAQAEEEAAEAPI